MSIKYDEKNKVFNLSTPNTTYMMGLFRDQFLVHLYYGAKIESTFCIDDVLGYEHKGFATVDKTENGVEYTQEVLPMEYSQYGVDLREPSFVVRYENGSIISDLAYTGYKISKGKPQLKGLPAGYVESDDEADTLEIELCDKYSGLKIILMYTVYNNLDIITRSVKAVNSGSEKLEILKLMSMSLDMFDNNYDFVHFWGKWSQERQVQKTPLINGYQGVDSKRGHSSHHHNPAFALARRNATETEGGVFGFALVYSGNFKLGVDVNSEGTSRCMMGINDFNFRWILEENEEFQAPEAVMSYSQDGFSGMSQNFHNFIRKRLCRGKFRDAQRPVLINNWEGTYFDFNEEKILNIAKDAKELGVELMVLDDGWFGHRDSADSSLGDWYADRRKLPNGIDGLAKKVNELGMQFGLWFEPEMVSPDSDLYRSHPDWILCPEGREPHLGRNQYVLDLSRDDVCDYVIGFMRENLKNAPISYVKWDMNRSMSEVGSPAFPTERQQEIVHRYMLGLYRILETLTTEFPDVLFEGCSGGGGRFDMGMFYYYPQFWTSDNSDAVERMYIQYGSSFIYPTSVMGAHYSTVPNHQMQRVTPPETRANVAIMGRFGYELDITKQSEEDLAKIREQIKFYKKWGQTIHNADMYRLMSPFEKNGMAVEFLSEDKKNIILFYGSINAKPQAPFEKVYFKGLDKNSVYRNTETGKEYAADILENFGYTVKNQGDFRSELVVFERVR